MSAYTGSSPTSRTPSCDPRGCRRLVVGALLSLVALVGPSRVHQGHHWLTDVSASYLLGISYLLGLSRLYRGLKARTTRERA